MSGSLDLTIRAAQIRQGLPTEDPNQVIAKTAVIQEATPNSEIQEEA